MSCGEPKCASTRRASSATSTACSTLMAPSLSRRHEASSPRTIHSSPTASPETNLSPNPRTAVMMTSPSSPVTELAVKATPAESASTMTCTSTAIRDVEVSPVASARASLYADTLEAVAESKTRMIAWGNPSRGTPRNVSYCPANEASSRSSAVPEERTANRWAPSSPAISNRSGDASRRCPSAADVTTKPGGTGNPAEARRAMLDAFAPSSEVPSPPASAKVTTSGVGNPPTPSVLTVSSSSCGQPRWRNVLCSGACLFARLHVWRPEAEAEETCRNRQQPGNLEKREHEPWYGERAFTLGVQYPPRHSPLGERLEGLHASDGKLAPTLHLGEVLLSYRRSSPEFRADHVRRNHGVLNGVVDAHAAQRAHHVSGVPDQQEAHLVPTLEAANLDGEDRYLLPLLKFVEPVGPLRSDPGE